MENKVYWTGIVKWNDGVILKTEPFYEYDEGIKVWSAKFSYENKGKFEWIDYEKIESNKEDAFAIKFANWLKKEDTQENADKWFHYSDEDMLNAFKEENKS